MNLTIIEVKSFLQLTGVVVHKPTFLVVVVELGPEPQLQQLE